MVYDGILDRVVLVTRRYPPEVGGYTFPGGGVESGESLTAAVMREVLEETGLVVTVDKLLGTWSTPTNETVITFYVTHPVGGTLAPGSDALSANWFQRTNAPALVFSVHQEVMRVFHHTMELQNMERHR